MVRSHTGRGLLLSSNLPQLQNLIKRDPPAYKEEFLQQWNHYKSILAIFQANPLEQSDNFTEMITFISQVAPCYPGETADFSAEISSLLMNNYGEMNSDTRKSVISNLIILRKKDAISPFELLKTLFPLLPRTSSSSLRSFIRNTIISEIRVANAQRVNLKLNRAMQAMLFRMVEQGADMDVVFDKGKKPVRVGDTSHHAGEDALWAVFLTKDLWKKGVWNDARSVSIISLGCFHPVVKVQSAALHFFLDEENEEESSDEEDAPNVKALAHRRNINKKTRSGDKKFAKDVKAAKKKTKTRNANAPSGNYAALNLLQDPQTFAEKLFDNLSRFDKRFVLEHKLLCMQVLCRALGIHQLCVLPFYTYLLKYLTAAQLRIPTILAALASSVHSLTPPDVLTPVLRKIAHEFVHPGVGSEVIAAGLNAIREVCKRQHLAMEEDLLGDLIEYRKSRDKGVIAAARGLLQLYRQEMPSMLKRRERGKEASMKGAILQPMAFGQKNATSTTIEGLDLLEEHIQQMKTSKECGSGVVSDDEEDWDGWEVESSSSDSSSESEGWIDVLSDSDNDLEISDSEDEKEAKQKERANADKDAADKNGRDESMEVQGLAEDADASQSLATTKILTPADFALLNDLRAKTAGGSSSKRKRGTFTKGQSTIDAGEEAVVLGEADILGPRKKAKATYEERMASIREGREGREKFGSSKGKKSKTNLSSTTNREKARNKPIMMVMASSAVRGKKRASLMEKQRRLQKHNDSQRRKRK